MDPQHPEISKVERDRNKLFSLFTTTQYQGFRIKHQENVLSFSKYGGIYSK